MTRAAIALSVILGLPLSCAEAADATTWCVRDPACPAGANASQTTIQGAVSAAAAGETILVGPGVFHEAVTPPTNVTIIGAGATQTIVQSPASAPTTTMNLTAGGVLEDVGIELAPGAGNTGLVLTGMASRVAVSAPGNATSGTGVQASGGVLNDSTVILPVGGSSTTVGVTTPVSTGAGAAVQDSTVQAATGLNRVAVAERDRIHATVGVVNSSPLASNHVVEDTLIATTPGAQPETGIMVLGLASSTNDAQINTNVTYTTIVGSGGAGSTGIVDHGTATATHIGAAAVSLSDSILRGFAVSIDRRADSSAGDTAFGLMSLSHSDLDTSTAVSVNTGSSSIGAIPAGFGNINADPLFINTSFGDPQAYHLLVDSPVIDAGDAGLSAQGSPVDADGNRRLIDGRNLGHPTTDMGAFEYEPHAPVAVIRASATTTIGQPVGFSAAGSSDPDAGDTLTFAWRFDDGGAAAGVAVTHAFATAGTHRATLTVTDRDGHVASAAASVVVTPATPVLTRLVISPASFHAAPSGPTIAAKRTGTTVSYTDSQATTTTVTVLRRSSGRHARYVAVGSITHRDRAGANRFHFSGRLRGRRLTPGRYQLQAVPGALRGGRSGPAASASFRVLPAAR